LNASAKADLCDLKFVTVIGLLYVYHTDCCMTSDEPVAAV